MTERGEAPALRSPAVPPPEVQTRRRTCRTSPEDLRSWSPVSRETVTIDGWRALCCHGRLLHPGRPEEDARGLPSVCRCLSRDTSGHSAFSSSCRSISVRGPSAPSRGRCRSSASGSSPSPAPPSASTARWRPRLARWPGERATSPNLPEPSAEFVIGAYHRLFQIEASFRISKHDLAVGRAGARNAAHVTRPADTRGVVHRAGRAVGRCSSHFSSAGGVVVGERPGRARGVVDGSCSGAGTRPSRWRRAAG